MEQKTWQRPALSLQSASLERRQRLSVQLIFLLKCLLYLSWVSVNIRCLTCQVSPPVKDFGRSHLRKNDINGTCYPIPFHFDWEFCFISITHMYLGRWMVTNIITAWWQTPLVANCLSLKSTRLSWGWLNFHSGRHMYDSLACINCITAVLLFTLQEDQAVESLHNVRRW